LVSCSSFGVEKPFYIYDVASGSVLYDLAAAGCSVRTPSTTCRLSAPRTPPRTLEPACCRLLLPSLLRPSSDGLPAEVSGAIICEDGALTPSFDYITALRASSDRADKARSHRRSLGERALNLSLEGHLFDTGILSRVLDLVEDSGDASAKILHCSVGKDRSTPTRMLLRVLIPNSGWVDCEANLFFNYVFCYLFHSAETRWVSSLHPCTMHWQP